MPSEGPFHPIVRGFSVSFPVGTLKWRNRPVSIILVPVLLDLYIRGPPHPDPPILRPLCSQDRCPRLGQIKPRASFGEREPPGDPLFLHSSARQTRVEWTLVVPVRDNVHMEWQLQLRVECRVLSLIFRFVLPCHPYTKYDFKAEPMIIPFSSGFIRHSVVLCNMAWWCKP